MKQDLNHMLRQFAVGVDTNPYGNGHINETYLVDCAPMTILQKINTTIFNAEEVMENIAAVTAHLRKKILAAGGDPMRETLTLVPTVDGKSYYTDAEGNAYRMY